LRRRVERFLGDREALDAPRSIAGRVELEDLPASDMIMLREQAAQAGHVHTVFFGKHSGDRYALSDALHVLERAQRDMEAAIRAHTIVHRFLMRIQRQVEDVDQGKLLVLPRRQEIAVRVHLGLIAFRLGIGEQFRQILSEERLATDENNTSDRWRKLVDDRFCLFRGQLHVIIHTYTEATVEVTPARELDGGDGLLDGDGFLHDVQKACFV